ncbi:MAG: glycosyltransferase family 2 protein [Arthrobacter sp.]
MAEWAEVLVVDGSEPEVFAAHSRELPAGVAHLAPVHSCLNGKVSGVLTGLELAGAELCVIADDDVRYTETAFRRVLALLADADVVRPQNYFSSLPWHARWDTARSLLNRALGADYPGTLGVRRSVLLRTGGYCGDVLFENLEMIRTVRAAGGREVRAPSVFVARQPCSARHFWSQRVRQAYDDFAQPLRLVGELALLPLLVFGTRRFRLLPAIAAAAGAGLAEAGRRRSRGREVFPASSAFWAPVWLLERSLAIWAALWLRLRGGVPYAGVRITKASHSVRQLRRVLREGAHRVPQTASSAEPVRR